MCVFFPECLCSILVNGEELQAYFWSVSFALMQLLSSRREIDCAEIYCSVACIHTVSALHFSQGSRGLGKLGGKLYQNNKRYNNIKE